MSIDFSAYTGWDIPEGKAIKVEDASGRVIWMLNTGSDKVILQVEKITSDTYAGETLYTDEQFILLDIYPKTNGTVHVTYGGLTKTITDTSGVAEPNAQRVFFGTFNGVSDSVATPASGELTIEGDCYAFGCSAYDQSSKDVLTHACTCVTAIHSFGGVTMIPELAFSDGINGCEKITSVEISSKVVSIGDSAFSGCSNLETVVIGKNVNFIGYHAFTDIDANLLKTVKVLAPTPPEIGTYTSDNGETHQYCFSAYDSSVGGASVMEEIIVPKGCGNAYKITAGWSPYADIIVEAS